MPKEPAEVLPLRLRHYSIVLRESREYCPIMLLAHVCQHCSCGLRALTAEAYVELINVLDVSAGLTR
jgi:hypothetical protein